MAGFVNIILIFYIAHSLYIQVLGGNIRNTRSADNIVLTLSVDNSIEVWVDGSSQGTHAGWTTPMTVTLPSNPGILSFKAHNSGGPAGVLASLSNGMVTEADEWRCTTSAPSDDAWKSGGFDDASWPVATEYGDNGVSPWGLINEVDAAAKWIWTSDNYLLGHIYCRIRIGIELLANCDDIIWVYADGVQYTVEDSSGNINWWMSEHFILPRDTAVLGIKCKNTGGPGGALASIYNGRVTDVNNWKCTHDPTDGWSELGYDDSWWDIPQYLGDHGVDPWNQMQTPYPISWDADWIWTQTSPQDTSGNHHTVYCRTHLATPVTCWTHYTNKNSVWGRITGGPRTDNRPTTFYFGDMGDDVPACAAACARESNCAAYTLHLTTFSASWAGQCYGRSDSINTLVNEVNIDCGVKFDCTNIPEEGGTVSSCTGVPNGEFQSSVNCNEYITCYYGAATTNTCPENQFWDDSLKRCSFDTSTCTDACSVGPCQHGGTCDYSGNSYTCTCPVNVHGDNCETVTIPTGQCVTDCSGVANGNYQSCISCSVYATCSGGTLTDGNACGSGTFWDDVAGECVEESQTCRDYCLVDSRVQCLSDGDGQANCENLGCCWDTSGSPYCFHSTENAISDDPSMTCSIPVNTRVECGYSGIAREECLGYGCCYYTRDNGPWCYNTEEPTEVAVGEVVSSCDGLVSGNYQSAVNCNSYVSCTNGDLYTSSCPSSQFWDDASKSCEDTTSTCQDACTPVPCQNGGTCTTPDGSAYSCACVEPYSGPTCEITSVPSGEPVSSCTNVEDGSYNSDVNCNQYVQCSGGAITSQTCPTNQFFDDDSDTCGSSTSTCEDECTILPCQNGGTCSYSGASYTCSCPSGFNGDDCEYIAIATGETVSSCSSVADGNYMSDTNCNEYVVCTGESLSRSNCPDNQFWDDASESCQETTDLCTDVCTAVPCQNGGTCGYEGASYACTCAATYSGTNCDLRVISTGDPISSCENIMNGYYQSTTNCNEYIECDNGAMTTRTCPTAEFWDDASDTCESTTGTCEDVCTVAPCLNGGTCGYQGDSALCECPEQYGGTICEIIPVPLGEPVSSCTNYQDGSYHSEVNCNEYVQCSGGDITSHTCPTNEYFNDNSDTCGASTTTCEDVCTAEPCQNGGTCSYSGNSYTCTCTSDYDGDDCELAAIPTGQTVSSCSGVADGSYMSETNCNEYVVCDDGALSRSTCPENEFWDDTSESCQGSTDLCTDVCTEGPCQNGGTCSYEGDSYSCTCAATYSGTNCDMRILSTGDQISNCDGIVNGFYQSTTNCNQYIECDNGVTTVHTCSAAEFWDDASDTCESTTGTCEDVCTVAPCLNGGTCGYQGDSALCECTEEYGGTICDLNQIPTGQNITSCTGVVDGSYHSNVTCNEYIVCEDEQLTRQSCAEGQFWDDEDKACGSSTSTCQDACTQGPCENGGTCLYDDENPGSYTCSCDDGFTGTDCESDDGSAGNAAHQQGSEDDSVLDIVNPSGGNILPVLAAGAAIIGLIAIVFMIVAARRRRKKKREEEQHTVIQVQQQPQPADDWVDETEVMAAELETMPPVHYARPKPVQMVHW